MFESLIAGSLWFIPGAPLLASLVTAAAGPRWLRHNSHVPCVAAVSLSFVLATLVLVSFLAAGDHRTAVLSTGFEWIRAGQLDVRASLQADAMTAVMLATVTLVSLLVAVYSIGYMHGDAGYSRFFAEIALFVFSMCGLVLASNFLVLFVFWEAVGLCSYLLIGFWFPRHSAAAAARKAFLVNRIGDLGFLLGVVLIWSTFGTLDFAVVLGDADQLHRLGSEQPERITLICLLLFIGAVGKSAQFPLHVWLPDAMEGPSPVSALIHAATMVTAGVYMVARCTPLFVQAPQAQLAVAWIGGGTALLAALIALTQNDLKRVLAYSTVSQLGYMFLALGSGLAGEEFVTFAVTAAMFHLFTHAFFKALLFLSAGSVMHAMGDVIDMRRFGGLARVLPKTHGTFLCGAAALAGVPLLSGFWSKDEILASLAIGTQAGPHAAGLGTLLAIAIGTAFLTALYTFRAYFLTFWGQQRFPPEAGEHPHEAPPVMVWPILILAGFSVLVGLVTGPTGLFAGVLERAVGLPPSHAHGIHWGVMGWSTLAALSGVGLAALLYATPSGWLDRLQGWLPGPYDLSLNKFYLDEIYVILVVRPVQVLAALSRAVDNILLDGLVDLVGWTPKRLGELFRPVQNGLVPSYALLMLLALAFFLFALLRTVAS